MPEIPRLHCVNSIQGGWFRLLQPLGYRMYTEPIGCRPGGPVAKSRLHFPRTHSEVSQGRKVPSMQPEAWYPVLLSYPSPVTRKPSHRGVRKQSLLTGWAGWQAAVLGAAAATSRGILVLWAGHHEVRERAWDVVREELGEIRFRGQGVLWKKAVLGEEGAPEADSFKH